MIKNPVIYLLCFTLLWTTVVPVAGAQDMLVEGMTEERIRKKYPNAKIIHVEPEEYEKVKEKL